MSIPFYDAQMDLLYHIASWRNPVLDRFFLFLNYFDSPLFFVILIPLIWAGISFRWGIRLAFLSVANFLINFHLKYLFNLPRPFEDDPAMAMLYLDSPGLPSGAAQQVVLLSILLIATWKNHWSYLVAFASIALISFSRLYLGVHYPMDVAAGWLVGLILAFVFLKIIRPLEEVLSKNGRALGLVLSSVICFLYIYLLPLPTIYQMMGAWLGFAIGVYIALEHRFYACWKKTEFRPYHGAAAVISLGIVYLLVRHHGPLFLQGLIPTLWISLGTPFLCNALFPYPKRNSR